MKRKELFIFNFILAVFVIASSYITWVSFANTTITEALSQIVSPSSPSLVGQAVLPHIAPRDPLIIGETNNRELQKLDEYQQRLGGFVTDELMFFINIASSESTIQENALAHARILQEYHQKGISPIVIIEPYNDSDLISSTVLASGAYQANIDTYFQQLKANGVTDEMLGVWVPFPEPNVPNWGPEGFTPENFGKSVNMYFAAMRNSYPNARGSILVNSTTYDPSDIEWDQGDYLSLEVWGQHINHSYIQSIGIQGFPWRSSAERRFVSLYEAQEFLQPDLAINLARELRVKDIWFNTGTFKSKYTNDPSRKVDVSASTRKDILDKILNVGDYIKNYQSNQYSVHFNIFAEDKTRFNEATDWSYLGDIEHETMFKNFLDDAHARNYSISLFDRTHNSKQ